MMTWAVRRFFMMVKIDGNVLCLIQLRLYELVH